MAISNRLIFSVLAVLAVATAVASLSIPQKRGGTPSICASYGYKRGGSSIESLLGELTTCAGEGGDPTSLLISLVAELNLCATVILDVGAIFGLLEILDVVLGLVALLTAVVNVLLLFPLTIIVNIIATVQLDLALCAVVNAVVSVYGVLGLAISLVVTLLGTVFISSCTSLGLTGLVALL